VRYLADEWDVDDGCSCSCICLDCNGKSLFKVLLMFLRISNSDSDFGMKIENAEKMQKNNENLPI